MNTIQQQREALRKVKELQYKIGKYIIDSYLRDRNETGLKEKVFTVKISESNGQIKFDIN